MSPAWQSLKDALGAENTTPSKPNAWIMDAGDLGLFISNKYFGVSIKQARVREMIEAFNLPLEVMALNINATIQRVEGEPPRKNYADLIPEKGTEVKRTRLHNRDVLLDQTTTGQLVPFDLPDDKAIMLSKFNYDALVAAGAKRWFAEDRAKAMRVTTHLESVVVGIAMPVRVS